MSHVPPGPAGVLHAILALGVEVAVLVAVYRLGMDMLEGWRGHLAGFGLMCAVVAVWARWGAPTSATRLTGRALLIFKVAVFSAGLVAFSLVDGASVAVIFVGVAVVHLLLALKLNAL
ncbi:DUF2568 domain-containing protein [Pseudooceanicola sp.]|uniref:DUF2568 domain-containing protein n=1 Tax=Pseudooceanicola sp. TaxID=1914328 RepID=UPI0035C693B2